jgi:hypothetical protein
MCSVARLAGTFGCPNGCQKEVATYRSIAAVAPILVPNGVIAMLYYRQLLAQLR